MVASALFPSITTLTVHSNSTSKVSNILGGYRVIGNSCVIDARFTVLSEIGTENWIFWDLPDSIFKDTFGHGFIIEQCALISTSGTTIPLNLAWYQKAPGYCGIGTNNSNPVPAGTYTLNLTYLIA